MAALVASPEERLFSMLIAEAEEASVCLAHGSEREELCTAIVGLRRRLATIRGECEPAASGA